MTINVPLIVVPLKPEMDVCDFIKKLIKKNKVVVKPILDES